MGSFFEELAVTNRPFAGGLKQDLCQPPNSMIFDRKPEKLNGTKGSFVRPADACVHLDFNLWRDLLYLTLGLYQNVRSADAPTHPSMPQSTSATLSALF
jgi:hypothetical protein